MWCLGEFSHFFFHELCLFEGTPQSIFNIHGSPGTSSEEEYGLDFIRYGDLPPLGTPDSRVFRDLIIPEDEVWSVNVSFAFNRINFSHRLIAALISGNAGYPSSVVDLVSLPIGSTPEFERINLSGNCSGPSSILFLADYRGAVSVFDFDSDATFVSSYSIPNRIIGGYYGSYFDDYEKEIVKIPDNPSIGIGGWFTGVVGATSFDKKRSRVFFSREEPYQTYYDSVDGDLLSEESPFPLAEMPFDLNIPENEIWDVDVSFNVERLFGNRRLQALLVNGDPADPSSIIAEYNLPVIPDGRFDSTPVTISGTCPSGSYLLLRGDNRGGVALGAFDSNGEFSSEGPEPETPNFQLTWWEPGSKVYERGVDRGVLYFKDGRVVPWSGLTQVTEAPGRGSEAVYYDGIKISQPSTIDGFSAKVQAITYPDQLEEAYGNTELRNGIFLGEQPHKTFGFSYRNKLGTELNEDAGYKIHLVYNILATPDDRLYQSISDEPNLTEFGWDFSTTPEILNGYRPSAHIFFDTTKVSPALITAVENILYGTADTPPRLPPLMELIELINEFENFITITDNGDGTWTASTEADGIINNLGGGVYEIQEANIQWTGPDTYIISSTPDPPTP